MDRQISPDIRRRRRLTRLGVGIGAGVLFITAIALAVGAGGTSVSMSDLETGLVTEGSLETSVNATGRVVPAFEQIITSPISTRIMEVFAREGDVVHVGSPLLQLDLQSASTEIDRLRDERRVMEYQLQQTQLNNNTYLSNLQMQVKVKQMDVDRKRVEVTNERRLDSIGSGTGDRVREAELAYRTGCLELEQLRGQLENERQVRNAEMEMRSLELSIFDKNFAEKMRTFDDARILAPRTATLSSINSNIGSQVAQGQQVAVISDLSHFKIEADISDSYSSRLSVGARVVARIGKSKFDGKVNAITPQSQNGVIDFTVTLDTDSAPQLRSGVRADVYVMCDLHENTLILPGGPYYKGPGEYKLFVFDGDDKLQRRTVRLGDSNFESVEVISGLEPSDRVVLNDMKDFEKSRQLKIRN